MDIAILSEASVPTPPAGYRTLFINTDKGNQLYYKNSDGTFTPYTADAESASSDIAEAWTECLCCALKNGTMSATEYQSLLDNGLEVTVTRTTIDAANGDYRSVVAVGSRTIALIDITLNATTAEVDVAATYQITTTFNPTNTTNQGLSYVSSNTAIATVSASGLVTGVGAGSVVITVIPLADPSKAKTVTIAVS